MSWIGLQTEIPLVSASGVVLGIVLGGFFGLMLTAPLLPEVGATPDMMSPAGSTLESQPREISESMDPPNRPKEPKPPRVPEPPEPRLVRDVSESEALAADWLKYMGWPKARTTSLTLDRGLDVLGKHPVLGTVAAQVKFEAKKTGRPAVQALYGAGHGEGAQHWIFFSSAGYSPMAIEWADQMEIGLFRFTLDGSIEPMNRPAKQYFRRRHVM